MAVECFLSNNLLQGIVANDFLETWVPKPKKPLVIVSRALALSSSFLLKAPNRAAQNREAYLYHAKFRSLVKYMSNCLQKQFKQNEKVTKKYKIQAYFLRWSILGLNFILVCGEVNPFGFD